MLDIKFLRENSDIVKENIKKKFQDEKLPLVDEVIKLDKGVIAFYIILAVVALFCAFRINNLNIANNSNNDTQVYCA